MCLYLNNEIPLHTNVQQALYTKSVYYSYVKLEMCPMLWTQMFPLFQIHDKIFGQMDGLIKANLKAPRLKVVA